MNTLRTIRLSIMLIVVNFIACANVSDFIPGAGGEESHTPRKGIVGMYITDFPLNNKEVTRVDINIRNIQIHSGVTGEWIDVIDYGEQGRNFDLLSLTNGRTENLGFFQLDVGHYSQMRLNLNSEHKIYVMENGVETVHPLKVPSGEQTGVKLVRSFEVTQEGSTEILVDFIADKSISYNRGQGYMLKPTIKVLGVQTKPGATRVIKAETGGEVEILNEVKLVIPPGALTEDLNISVAKVDTTPVPAPDVTVEMEGHHFQEFVMEPHGLTFTKPVEMQFDFDATELSSAMAALGDHVEEANLIVQYLHEESGIYFPVSSTIDYNTQTVTAATKHFSRWCFCVTKDDISDFTETVSNVGNNIVQGLSVAVDNSVIGTVADVISGDSSPGEAISSLGVGVMGGGLVLDTISNINLGGGIVNTHIDINWETVLIIGVLGPVIGSLVVIDDGIDFIEDEYREKRIIRWEKQGTTCVDWNTTEAEYLANPDYKIGTCLIPDAFWRSIHYEVPGYCTIPLIGRIPWVTYGGFTFFHSCQRHDLCDSRGYSTYGKDFGVCNDEMDVDMYNNCQTVKQTKPFRYPRCLTIMEGFDWALNEVWDHLVDPEKRNMKQTSCNNYDNIPEYTCPNYTIHGYDVTEPLELTMSFTDPDGVEVYNKTETLQVGNDKTTTFKGYTRGRFDLKARLSFTPELSDGSTCYGDYFTGWASFELPVKGGENLGGIVCENPLAERTASNITATVDVICNRFMRNNVYVNLTWATPFAWDSMLHYYGIVSTVSKTKYSSVYDQLLQVNPAESGFHSYLYEQNLRYPRISGPLIDNFDGTLTYRFHLSNVRKPYDETFIIYTTDGLNQLKLAGEVTVPIDVSACSGL